MGNMTGRGSWVLCVAFAALSMGGCKATYDVCGDAVCGYSEDCRTCTRDCGSCTGCGDGFCAAGESCTVCPRDCGSCGVCNGDGVCNGAETCSNCPGDCGTCTACGDGACNASIGETCSTCARDCGSCSSCGDGRCLFGETCTNCPGDCGQCAYALPYQACRYDMDCQNPSDSCIAVTRGGITRSFCGIRNCGTDNDCDRDMYGALGLCVSFSGGASFDCFHRCNTSSDCYPGFTCGPTDGNPSLMVCLPGGAGLVPPYGLCNTSADCAGGLTCTQFTVGGASTRMCSLTGCRTDNDCPIDMRGGNGACLNLGGTSACWERCTVRGDCPNTTQFDCTTNINGNVAPVPVCVVHN